MVTIQLRAHLAFLMLPLFVFGVPTDEPDPKEVTTTPSSCRRCCDPLNSHESPEAAPDLASRHSLPYPMPEVRPYINITILKGECHACMLIMWGPCAEDKGCVLAFWLPPKVAFML